MPVKHKVLFVALLAILMLSHLAMAAPDGLLTQADKLMKRGKAKEAYALLVPYQSELAGDPNYDYLLGIAALDSGRANEAVFALERVLAVNPNHLQARAEIAKAYFATGEVVASQHEFETVQQQNPPKEVSATIEKFLGAIERAKSGERTTIRTYVESALGDDSNVNSATAASQVAIPFFGGAISTLSANGQQLHDSFGSVAVGGSVRHALTPEWSIFGGGSFNQRFNSSQTAFDTGGADVNAGISLTKGDNNYSVSLQSQDFSIDDTLFRNATGATAQLLHSLDNDSQASAYFQYTELHYPGRDIQDANRYILGGAYAHALGGQYVPTIYFGGYAGEEKERAANVPHLGHKPYGVRAGGEMRLNPQTILFSSASVEQRRYGGPDPLFLVTRRDTQSDLVVGLSYVPLQNWTITPQAGFTRNSSNIVINAYSRAVYSVVVRRDFN